MEKETREAVFDGDLGLEAFRLRGMSRPFPMHFHEHYVFGLVEAGKRELRLGEKRLVVESGCVLTFAPGESHGCVQCGGELDYRGLNVPVRSVQELMRGKKLPRTAESVLRSAELCQAFRQAHEAVICRAPESERRELMKRLLALLTRERGAAELPKECRSEVESACEYMRGNYSRRISLDELCRHAGMSRAALERAFAVEKGISPHRYLESVRVSNAKRLLGQGVPPCESALLTGFSDQSHFTNRFRALTGLAPGLYSGIFRNEDGDMRNGD
ncbi:MAG: AraC family transcriptional regulator [Butyricicoccus sp.]|nr:AraC family transcriptional regulator [Butyricicoccus sp.]